MTPRQPSQIDKRSPPAPGVFHVQNIILYMPEEQSTSPTSMWMRILTAVVINPNEEESRAIIKLLSKNPDLYKPPHDVFEPGFSCSLIAPRSERSFKLSNTV